MIFGFWTQGPPPAAAVAAWRAAWPAYRLCSDDDVRPLLSAWGMDACDLYEAIRIPACRSDLARLVMLHRSGGLYVDLHAAPGSVAQLGAVLGRLCSAELVIFDESAHRNNDRHTWLMNGALAARSGSQAIGRMIRTALGHLHAHRNRERAAAGKHVPYSIFDLTGPAVLWHELFDRVPEGGALKLEYQSRVEIWPINSGAAHEAFYFHRHTGFRPIERHWSRRQQTEPLFDLPDQAVLRAFA